MDEKTEEKETEGSLKLEGFNNLEELYCFDTKITCLDLSEGSESKLWGIMESIKKLEKAAIEYRRLSYYGTNKEIIKVNSQQSEERKKSIQIITHNFSEIRGQQEVPPKNLTKYE